LTTDLEWVLENKKAQIILMSLLDKNSLIESQIFDIVKGNPNTFVELISRLKKNGFLKILASDSFPFSKHVNLTELGRQIAILVRDSHFILSGKLPKPHQEIVVYLIHRLKKIVADTRVMKLMFLLQKEFDLSSYDFVPHFFGPYSRELSNDIAELVSKSILFEDILKNDKNDRETKVYSLTTIGEAAAKKISARMSNQERKKISLLIEKYSKLTLQQLLSYVYRQYPDFSKNSLIKGSVPIESLTSFWDVDRPDIK
jgi:uncharacterized protein YwgA